MQGISYILLGLVAGAYGGAFGLGGGAVMVPALVLLMGFTQQQAQGTALAVMMLPVFIPAVIRYYVQGNVNVPAAAFMAAGFVGGAFLGAHMVQYVDSAQLKKVFGVLMILIGIKMLWPK